MKGTRGARQSNVRQQQRRGEQLANPQEPFKKSAAPNLYGKLVSPIIKPINRAESPDRPSARALPSLTNSARSGGGKIYRCDSNESLRSRSSARGMFAVNAKHQRYETILEAFLVNTMSMELHAAIEQTFMVTLKAATVTLWQDIPTLHVLYSQRIQKTVGHSTGLVGFTFFSREIVKSERSEKHSAYKEDVDMETAPPGTPVMLFPLWDSNGNVCGVVEVTRDPKDDFFDEDDEDFVQFFIKKFRIYSGWLNREEFPHETCLELMQSMEIEQYLIVLQRKMASLFSCRIIEIWKMNMDSREMKRYGTAIDVMNPDESGIVGECLLKNCPINCPVNKLQSSYCEAVDGPESEPVLSVPVVNRTDNMKYIVVLRGHKGLPIFTMQDEKNLRALAPYLVLGLDNNEKYSSGGSQSVKSSGDHQCVSSLKKVVDMVCNGDPLNDSVSHAVNDLQKLTNADKVYLFVPDRGHSAMDVKIATGVKEKLSIPFGKGIVGRVFSDGKITNLSDAYEDPGFYSGIDLQIEYRTKQLATAPVLNNRREVLAVAQLLNKKDGKPFSNLDLQFLKIYTTLCGMMMENEHMFAVSSQSANTLRSYLNVSLALSSNQSMKTVLNEIMQNARKVINAERASLFLLDNVVGALTTYLADGGGIPATIPLGNGIAATSAKTKKSIIVNDAYHDPQFNKMIDYKTGFRTKSVLSVAIVSSDGEVLGVTEMVNKLDGGFTQDDLKIMESFATFAAVALENRKLKNITERGTVEIEMNKWIGEFEKKSYEIPMKLAIPDEKKQNLLSLDFFCWDFNGIGLFKICYYIFNNFRLLETMHITNDLFFTFLFRLRESYNEPPYHNWIHAIDVLQFFAYQIRASNFDKTLTALEILAICVAAISHDAGHEGYNNVYNEKAETPLGILFKDQSVMETHHCTIAVRIISRDECNIFHSLSDADLKRIWKWIIKMILATDMAHHFKLVKNANDIMDQGPINLANESHRMMAMTMLMKVADISNVSRPFEIADKWCTVLCEEFWRQGDMELSQGLEISSPLNDRRNNNKPKGQIGFYNFICLPLYQVLARIFPELEINVEAVKANLEKWKELLAQQESQV